MRRIPLSLVLWSMAACSTAPEQHTPTSLPNTGQPALHALHDTRLRDLMAEMNSLMFERMRTELELDQERRQRARQIAASAAGLTRTIDAIVATLPRLNLNPGEQTTFIALANKLRGQTKLLEEQASRNQIDAMPATLDQMASTCTACHQLFRKIPG